MEEKKNGSPTPDAAEICAEMARGAETKMDDPAERGWASFSARANALREAENRIRAASDEITVEACLAELREIFPADRLNIRHGVDIWWWMADQPEPFHQQVGGWSVSLHVPSASSDFGAYGHLQSIGSGVTLT